MILLAMDRSQSVRRFDADGRLHVEISNISKANVCDYLGREIPGWQELGLDGDRVYRLLRDPVELAAAADTFNNLPVLAEHVPVTAFGEGSHREDLVVGSTGTDGAFDGQYLTNSLVIWAKASIDGIVKDEKRELSSAYRYSPDMTPGIFGGIAYDGVMRNIIGNHVALVIEGRAGPDVVIGDAQPMSIRSKRALVIGGSLAGLVRPLLAHGAKFDIAVAMDGVSAKSMAKPGAARTLGEKVFGLVQPHLAADAKLDVDAVYLAIDAANGAALAEDDDIPVLPGEKIGEDEDDDKVAEDEDDDKVAEDEDDDDKPAMDHRTVKKMVATVAAAARKGALADAKAIRLAEREVFPVVGELPAMDSAADVYRAGLKALNVDASGLPDKSLGVTFRAIMDGRSKAPKVAQDSRPAAAAHADFNGRFPNRAKLIKG